MQAITKFRPTSKFTAIDEIDKANTIWCIDLDPV